MRAADYLINSEAETLLPRCQQRLAQGDTILIFPEGTRTKPGEKMTLQRGAANIAVRCASDLRIVTIGCSEHLLDKQSNGMTFHLPGRFLRLKSMIGLKSINFTLQLHKNRRWQQGS